MKRLLTYLTLTLALCACAPRNIVGTGAAPQLVPDIADVTVPRTTAPLNFSVSGADKLQVEITGEGGRIVVRGAYADIPAGKWRCLLAASDELEFKVSALKDGRWYGYEPFKVNVSGDPVDGYLVYRRIDPGYEVYARMGIYQRDLSSFDEKVVFDNSKVSPGCVNCHSTAQCDPSHFQLHLRGNKGGTYLRGGGQADRVVNMKNDRTLGTVYPYWHPSGDYIAYSANDIRQSFHNVPEKVLEVYDLASDVVIYDVRKDELTVCPELQDSAKLETFPAFSPDGRTLYYCCADMQNSFEEVRYSLMSIGFDPEDGRVVGQPRLLWSAEGKSVSFPRPSYDGRFLMFTLSDFGNFSIWHPEADLWLLDLETGEARCLDELNSPDTESYHSWSSDSRWVVFSSRRLDGRFTRLYMAHMREDGSFDKPFPVPFRSPEDETLMLQSYNIPEFCSARLKVDRRLIYSTERKQITIR